ncbi:MAG TPA: FAD-dependent oxidoreductase [Hanamia sp.]|nr:FAD-dependent oxidoreductase [Hanamia sp.]
MNRRNFVEWITLSGGAIVSGTIPGFSKSVKAFTRNKNLNNSENEFPADVVIAGAGLGGFAATMAALRNGLSVILTEETNWIGGQLTQQGLSCPDEHPWIETHGATQLYRDFRIAVREYYLRNYPLTQSARTRKNLNPGDGLVSRLCFEPRVAISVMYSMLAPYINSGKLRLLLQHKIISADVSCNKVNALKALTTTGDKKEVWLKAPYFIDATELGDLLPITGTEYVTGSESRHETHELHASEKADPKNIQAFTFCLVMDYIHGSNYTIDKPAQYDFWKNFIPNLTPPWPGKLLDLSYSIPSTLQPKNLGFSPDGTSTGSLLNLWNYRRIINKENFKPGTFKGDISIINWPQNDYMTGSLIDVPEEEFIKHIENSKQLSLSLFYWLQTEAPHSNGGKGWPGLRLRGDVYGTDDGLAKYPYNRESRRIKSVFTILEEHVGKANRALITGKESGNKAANFFDSVGTGYYHIDLHPTIAGNNYIDFDSLPFQIPLGALLPVRMENLFPANKNIGTTHITNGCYRLHPVEWGIGEAAGMLIAFSQMKKVTPHSIREKSVLLEDFQNFIRSQGLETHWPKDIV